MKTRQTPLPPTQNKERLRDCKMAAFIAVLSGDGEGLKPKKTTAREKRSILLMYSLCALMRQSLRRYNNIKIYETFFL